MKKTLFISLLASILLLAWCNKISISETPISGATQETTEMWALDTAKAILQTLKNNDLQTLATFVGPQGVRFSPYAHIDTTNDIILQANELLALYTNTGEIKTWWAYDGSGEPINLNFQEYSQKFVYDIDFLNAPEVNENQDIMRGNIISNVFDIYAGKYIVEFHIPGIDPQYEGMDRRSLYLVLENTDDAWHLIGIIHNQRTI